ncbi:hypothetical protein [Streptomyces chilikensis]|uniref:Uncharacterized protein n=1 Tax=Streptomyces chilikensis TaxID=1194079 RepID=A0ABV3ERI4_9ACTN
MADTAPTAVPDPQPNTTPTATPAAGAGGLSGLIAGVLEPVQPARPTMNDTSTAHAEGTGTAATAGASSADYHPDTDGQDDGKPGKTSTSQGSRAQQSVIREWLIAGAYRWKKGADARIKRLDVAKARAMAARSNGTSSASRVQIPSQSRTSNGSGGSGNGGGKGRSGSGGTGPSASGAGGSKGLGSKQRSNGAGGGPKNTTPKGPGPSRSNSSGSTPKGNGHGASNTPKTPRTPDKPSKAPKTAADTTSSSRTPGKGNQGGKRPSGGVDSPQAPHGGLPPKTPKPKKNKSQAGETTAASGTTTPANTTGKGKGGKTSPAAPEPRPTVTSRIRKALTRTNPDTPAATVKDTKSNKPKPSAKPGEKKNSTTKTPAAPTNSAKTPKAPNLKASRETGYRDGARTGTLAAHMQAYRDGLKDGWKDVQQAAANEKNRLDHAHTWRKAKKENAMPPTTAPAPPRPITVDAVTPTHVLLGADANRPDMHRGEVRTLRQFQRRLETKAADHLKTVEETRGLQAHAMQQATKALRLLEAARGVKGGDKLVASLTRAHETAQAQAAKAEDIHKRALRAAEACRTLAANTHTRYGGIYQAVVDSDTVTPAELAFYKN